MSSLLFWNETLRNNPSPAEFLISSSLIICLLVLASHFLLIKFISFFVLSYARLVWFKTVKCWTLFLLLLFLLNIYFYLLIWLCQALVVAHGSSLCHTGLRLSCPEACGILVPPASIEPMSPALQGRYLATGLPGKSHQTLFSIACQRISSCTVS